MTEQTLKDIDRAFKALEERDELLDKIKEEIIWYRDNKLSYEANSETIELTNYYLNIIDKYKSEESEDKR